MQTTNLQSLRELRTQEKAIKAGIEDEVSSPPKDSRGWCSMEHEDKEG